jgi:hypothetical protein
MPLKRLVFRPGVNRDTTSYAGSGGFYDCDKIRFRSGFPEKIGGWVRYVAVTLLGVCRSMFNWVTSYSDNLMAYGTNKKVYIEAGGNLIDITPLESVTLAGDVTFAATDGSSIIVVTNISFPSNTGSFVTFKDVDAGGLGGNITQAVLEQNYEIVERLTADTYTISARSPTTGLPVLANASDIGDGGLNVFAEYEIPIGFPGGTFGYGWGTDTWGRGTWGSGSTVPLNLNQREWWFDNFDNDLFFNLRRGPIYTWERGTLTDPSVAFSNRAVLLSSLVGASNVPTIAMQILVSQNDKHLLAFGTQPFGGGSTDFDPLLIRWANQDEPENWTPTPTNSAGFIQISRGSRIIRALPTRQEILVFTESHLYSLQFLGTTDVFGLQEYADNISIISARSVVSANNVTYWMGKDKFYSYTGRVETLPTTLRNYVFEDLNYNQTAQIFSGTNEGWNEIWWFYPSKASNQVNRYVIYNYVEQIWYYGTISRTAWLDTPLREYPQAVESEFVNFNGIVYNHETGQNDGTLPMSSFIETNDFDLEEGNNIILTQRIIPDLNLSSSTASSPQVRMSIRPKMFPGAPQSIDPDDTKTVVSTTIDQYTNQVFIRSRGRQLAFRISSNTLNTQWQLGAIRIDGRPDGQR